MRRVERVQDTGADMFIFDGQKDLNDWNVAGQFVKSDFFKDVPKSWEELQKKLVEDWKYGMEVLTSFVKRLKQEAIPDLKSTKRTTTFSMEEGEEIDLERLAQGLPYWKHTEREEKTGPQDVTIIIDTTTIAYRDTDDILWRGACALGLAFVLEEKGYKVELWVVNGSYLYTDGRTPVVTACCLKRPQDPLDLSTLVSTVSGWFYRSATFTLLRTIGHKTGKEIQYESLGAAYEPRSADLDEVSRDELRIYSSGVFSFSAAVSMIRGELEKFAAKGEPA